MKIHLESGSCLLSLLAVMALVTSISVEEPLKGLFLEWALAAGLGAWLHYLATQANQRFRPKVEKIRVKTRD